MNVVMDFVKGNLYLQAEREAYGPSRNEGLCYESCQRVAFKGDINGAIHLCMDGYTKLKLLPRIADRFQIDPTLRGMADSVLLEFTNQVGGRLLEELIDGGFNLQLLPPETLSHKLVPIDLARYRQFIVIFFLRDRREGLYLGRLYVVLTMQKYETPLDPASA